MVKLLIRPAIGQMAKLWESAQQLVDRFHETTGHTHDGTAGEGPKLAKTALLLDYVCAADLANGVAVSATTWSNVGSHEQTFVVASADSLIAIAVGGYMILGGAATALNTRAAVAIDAATALQLIRIGGARAPAGEYANPLAGTKTIWLQLAAGSHTIKVDVYSSGAATLYCVPASAPDQHGLSISVLEYKR